MNKNIVYLSFLEGDISKAKDVEKGLNSSGFVTKTTDISEDYEKKVRVALLRADAVVVALSAKTLKEDEFFQHLEIAKKYNRTSTPMVYLLLDESIDALFDKIYADETYSDDALIRADDFRDDLMNKDYVFYDANINENLKNKLIELGLVPYGSSNDEIAAKKETQTEIKKVEAAKVIEEIKAEDNKKEEIIPEAVTPVEEKAEAVKDELKANTVSEKQLTALEEVKQILENNSVKANDNVVALKKAPKVNEIFLRQAIDKFNQQKYLEAFDIFMRTEDHPKAQEYIAYLYLTGFGVDKNEQEAFNWYKKAVENDNKDAYFGLAECYYYAIGTRKDDQLAIKYYKLPADLGDRDALYKLANAYFYGQDDALDYQQAMKIYKNNFGDDPDAIYNMGYMYYNGLGCEEDKKKAFDLYKLAAQMGNSKAYNDLANMYFLGEEVEQNYAQAFKYYAQAAKLGEDAASYNLAESYFYGTGIKVDRKKAILFYKKAASQGSSEAEYKLGTLSDAGDDVELSYDEAFKWYKRAAEQGHPLAEKKIGDHYYFGYGVKPDKEEAFRWYLEAAKHKNVDAMLEVAWCYRGAVGVNENPEEAFKWFSIAASYNNEKALNYVGDCYNLGIGVEADSTKAFESYKKAAEINSTLGQLNVGKCYYNGTGVERDYKQAQRWYEKAAMNDQPEAQFLLAKMYYDGFIGQDYSKAMSWFKRSAKNDYAAAYYMISHLYQYGLGVKENKDLALSNLQEAADLGDELALYDLGDYYGAKGDREKAFEYYEEASNKGFQTATLKLASCYYLGFGIQADKDYAYDLAYKLATQGNEEAKKFIYKYFNEEV